MPSPTIAPHALTSLTKVKALLNISVSTYDTLLSALVSEATDLIEGLCGGRRFLRTTYTQEEYDVTGRKVFLKNRPITTISAFQYRSGSLSSPTWTDCPADSYLPDLNAGYIETFGSVPCGMRAVRVTYTAGYLIDFTDEWNTAVHTLPTDITKVCTELAGAAFNRRQAAGISSQGTEGQNVSFAEAAKPTEEQMAVITRYANTWI